MAIVVDRKVQRWLNKNIGEVIHSPQQRFIQGATALAIQPCIDYNNKSADKDTRAVSVARTIGKIVAGTLVGVLVRYGSIKAVKSFSSYRLTYNGFNIDKIRRHSKKDIFTPIGIKIDPNKTNKEFGVDYNNYVNGMGTVVAAFAMIFTNFLIDAPLTRVITQALTKRVKARIDKKEPEVPNGRP